jgi:hypothetical protein
MVKNTVFRVEKLGLSLSQEFLMQYFNTNADLQPFYPELREDLDGKIGDFLECMNRPDALNKSDLEHIMIQTLL